MIVDCTADTEKLRERVSARGKRGRDASEATLAVFEHLMATHAPFTAQETQAVVPL